MVPRKQAGHMTCTRPQAERQILLATRASSTHDPTQTYLVSCLTEQGVVNGPDFRVMNDLVSSNPAGLHSNAEIKRRG